MEESKITLEDVYVYPLSLLEYQEYNKEIARIHDQYRPIKAPWVEASRNGKSWYAYKDGMMAYPVQVRSYQSICIEPLISGECSSLPIGKASVKSGE